MTRKVSDLLGLSGIILAMCLLSGGMIACFGYVVSNAPACEEWVEDGGFTCVGDANFKQCFPNRRCVRYREEP